MKFNTATRWEELFREIRMETAVRLQTPELATVDTPANVRLGHICILNERATQSLVAAKAAFSRNSILELRSALQDLGALYFGSKVLDCPISEPIELPLLVQRLLELDK